jgi:hypothetical protein
MMVEMRVELAWHALGPHANRSYCWHTEKLLQKKYAGIPSKLSSHSALQFLRAISTALALCGFPPKKLWH